jgi:hypothetical protein
MPTFKVRQIGESTNRGRASLISLSTEATASTRVAIMFCFNPGGGSTFMPCEANTS